jgi:hypothetical protein
MDKEEQKRLITEIMNEDAKDGLYEPAQTATEWLFVQLYEKFEMKGDGREMSKVLEQAKAIEKQRIEQSWVAALDYAITNMKGYNNLTSKDAFEKYYNKTYNK